MTKVSQNTPQQITRQISIASWVWLEKSPEKELVNPSPQIKQIFGKIFGNFRQIDILKPLKQWLDNLEVRNSYLAHQICKSIPAQCPFERDVKFWGRILFHIPPMCKLNPIYDQLVGLRFRALCYLVDECGEDISAYC
jgi:hypothetical protein